MGICFGETISLPGLKGELLFVERRLMAEKAIERYEHAIEKRVPNAKCCHPWPHARRIYREDVESNANEEPTRNDGDGQRDNPHHKERRTTDASRMRQPFSSPSFHVLDSLTVCCRLVASCCCLFFGRKPDLVLR